MMKCYELVVYTNNECRRKAWSRHHDSTVSGKVVLAPGANHAYPSIYVMENHVEIVKASFIIMVFCLVAHSVQADEISGGDDVVNFTFSNRFRFDVVAI